MFISTNRCQSNCSGGHEGVGKILSKQTAERLEMFALGRCFIIQLVLSISKDCRLQTEMVKASSEAVDVTLALVARGNAILAEIERLSDIIPLLFRSLQ